MGQLAKGTSEPKMGAKRSAELYWAKHPKASLLACSARLTHRLQEPLEDVGCLVLIQDLSREDPLK